ncbi:hypothetical protein OG756_20765 [Streptomyces sp. NBC_01310]|uniref:hypothetical protein n=1 Tax=Streptomyces sp. NBC_01310 TaxID=2903820 RepID=UPI0035B5F928|nr:hypothetical protein OG756_20765 [Streptomyces sp. NBC_01310]
MEAQESTDVWFRSHHRTLEELATALGAEVVTVDEENYWEWVIADFAGVQIDITRTHTTAPEDTDTRIFPSPYMDLASFPRHVIRELVTGLQRIGTDPIHVGEWVYLRDNDFDRVVHETITAEASPTRS